MLERLPLEIQVSILEICDSSQIRLTSSHFYILHNDLFYDKLVKQFGEVVIVIIAKIYKQLRAYVRSLDAFRYASRMIIASRLKLTDYSPYSLIQKPNLALQAQFVRDSWRYVYSIFKNKRLFAEYSDYTIDEPSNYIYNHYVEINRTYLLSYSKSTWLAPGSYNLNIGLVIKHGNGLGTTKFEVKFRTTSDEVVCKTFYPPTNIKDILPKNQFCFLKVAEFVLPSISRPHQTARDEHHYQQLYKVDISMEEIGLYLKSGFSIYFIDISQPSMLFNDFDLLYYAIQETDYHYFINLPLKHLYKALELTQASVNAMVTSHAYDKPTLHSKPSSVVPYTCGVDQNNHQHWLDEAIQEYGNSFYKTCSIQRLFKFNTIYQQRQFINRFGDFLPADNEQSEGTRCTYDTFGLKWRIPILGDL